MLGDLGMTAGHVGSQAAGVVGSRCHVGSQGVGRWGKIPVCLGDARKSGCWWVLGDLSRSREVRDC